MNAPTDDFILRGYLVIYVDGYKMKRKHMVHFLSDGDELISVPDRLLPPPNHEVGSMSWWEDGWVVGDNQRDRLCKRFGRKPFKKFYDFDQAVDFAYRRQQRFKSQQHILVYVTKTMQGKEREDVVRSTDDIEAIHVELDQERQEVEAYQSKRKAERDAEHPHLDRLREKFGFSKGWQLSEMLRQIRESGREIVFSTMPKSTWYRLKRELREIGLEP